MYFKLLLTNWFLQQADARWFIMLPYSSKCIPIQIASESVASMPLECQKSKFHATVYLQKLPRAISFVNILMQCPRPEVDFLLLRVKYFFCGIDSRVVGGKTGYLQIPSGKISKTSSRKSNSVARSEIPQMWLRIIFFDSSWFLIEELSFDTKLLLGPKRRSSPTVAQFIYKRAREESFAIHLVF